jgi:hypothetical protein
MVREQLLQLTRRTTPLAVLVKGKIIVQTLYTKRDRAIGYEGSRVHRGLFDKRRLYVLRRCRK